MTPTTLHGIVNFYLPGGLAGVGSTEIRTIDASRTYEVRVDAPALIVDGGSSSLSPDTVTLLPEAGPIRVRFVSNQVSMAAAGTANARAWLIPVDG